MSLKSLVQPGDILIIDGQPCIYAECTEVGSPPDYMALLRAPGYKYYSLGLQGFNEDLCHNSTGSQVTEIYRPFNQIKCIPKRDYLLKYINLDELIINSVKIFPDDIFINIESYV